MFKPKTPISALSASPNWGRERDGRLDLCKQMCSHTGIQFIQMMLGGAHIEEIYNEPSSDFELNRQSEPETTGLMDVFTGIRSRHLGYISKLT